MRTANSLEKTDAGKDWRWEKKGMTEDEMVGGHHWLNRHEFKQAPGDGEPQGSLEYCIPWGHKESDTTEQLNKNNNCDFLSLASRRCHITPVWDKVDSSYIFADCMNEPLSHEEMM